MPPIDRRAFLEQAAAVTGLGLLPGCGRSQAAHLADPVVDTKPAAPPSAHDLVKLGRTGIRISRLGMGTGTFGGREQRELGVKGLADLFRHGFDQGVRYWDLADMYKTHPHAREALRAIDRDNVVILTKSRSKEAADVKKDVDRFLKELDTDYLDICLLHCMQDPGWTTKMRAHMDVLSEAKAAGKIRAVGCSCHTLGALRAAADSNWVDVDLARINHTGVKMDAGPDQVVPVLKKMKAAGKGVLGMKILGEGQIAAQRRKSLNFVLNLGCVDAFNVGFGKSAQLDDIAGLIPEAAAHA